ncbi:transcriptional repressor [Aquimarina sp. MMG016]|uniref:Fur family transcriptional regulator n=1 Tax=Aquimarina sp. MMG016 TaxID=2822690 RepID=UPI001B39FE6E|nr:transcriptional repressor [Aquimarina sp. MMG016]MBQ4822280.1 transcriptional repressor [Aquimarina sp. MMG016]
MKRRTTQSKTEILNILKSAESALSHDMLQARLVSNIDRATIYRILNRFCEDGWVHKIVGDDGKRYFALCLNYGNGIEKRDHNHFHFRCLDCGKLECINNEIDVPLPSGYVSKSFNGIISGYCKNCS